MVGWVVVGYRVVEWVGWGCGVYGGVGWGIGGVGAVGGLVGVGVSGVLLRNVVGGGGRVGSGVGDGVLSGWCAMGIIIFQGVLTKLNFLMKFLHLSKFIDLMQDLKYEHQNIFVY